MPSNSKQVSFLPQTKYGKCSKCPATDTMVVKVKKDLLCLACNKTLKTEQQLAKAKERDKLRGIGREQVKNGSYDEADRQALINELDWVFSRIVRLRESDKYSNCKCFTCGLNKHWSMQQCGHFVKRGNTQLRWEFKNGKVQCKHCNENLGGNLEVYATNLDKEEAGLSLQLIEIGREVYSWSREELKQLLFTLREKLRLTEQVFKEKTGQKI